MTVVDITCLCGLGKSTAHITGSVPIENYFCHRTTCRRNLGTLFHSTIRLQARPDNIDKLCAFNCDEGLTRYFCGKCGSHVFEEEEGVWKVQSGAIDGIHTEQVFEALETIAGHRYANETIDGGLSLCLKDAQASLSEETMQPHVDTLDNNDPPLLLLPPRGSNAAQLTASCICGGVQFFLTRPNAESSLCSSPWPDLIMPYWSHSSANPQDRKWWIKPDGKWFAGTCGCRSCRLGSGSSIQAWAFVARVNIFEPDNSPLSYKWGRLRSFESSPGVTREFCGSCGATAFWHDTNRPGVVDVSVGLLQAAEGALARSWLDWCTERVSFAEEALDQRLIASVQEGLGYLSVSS